MRKQCALMFRNKLNEGFPFVELRFGKRKENTLSDYPDFNFWPSMILLMWEQSILDATLIPYFLKGIPFFWLTSTQVIELRKRDVINLIGYVH